jgi:Tol biopolymer transport system component
LKPDTNAQPRPEQVLSCWKDIANYLDRDVRTVQRWEQARGLPVHRLPGNGKNSIYALRSELDRWWADTPERREQPDLVALPAPPRRRLQVFWAGVAAVTAMGITAWILVKPAAAPLPLRPELLTTLAGAEMFPSLSPDGKRLVFTWWPPTEDRVDLYTMTLPAGKPERLTSSPGLHLFSEWSPDGSRIAYGRLFVGAGSMEVRLIDINTKEDTLLFTGHMSAVAPPVWLMAWSRRGDALFLPTARDENHSFGLSLLDIGSGKQTRLTTPDDQGFWDMLPAPSPDGSSLVFLRRKIAAAGNLFRQDLNRDGSPRGPARQITHEECCVGSPSWSADGGEVIFLSGRGGTPRLMRVDAQGGAARQQSTVPRPSSAPRVARNGWLLTWDFDPSNHLLELPLRKGAAAGPARQLMASSRRDSSPAFSPDSAEIVFRSDRSGLWQLWVYSRKDKAVRQLTRLDGIEPMYPDWSPGGRWIAFEGHAGKAIAAYIVDTVTARHWRVTPEVTSAWLPRWSRSGNSLYIASDRTERTETWRLDIDGNGQAVRATQVTAQGGFSGVESPDGRFVYYSKEMTLESIWRVPAGGGKEEAVLRDFAFNRYPTNLAAGPDGLYFRGQGAKEGVHGQPVWMLPFAGGRPRQILVEPEAPSPGGIAVSPDGQALLLTTVGYQAGDVVAYKNFR